MQALGKPNTPLSKTLKTLNVSCLQRITDDGVKGLKGLTLLEDLWLWDPSQNRRVSGACLQDIASFQHLTSLVFCIKNVNDNHIQPLADCARLSKLDLRYTSKITGSGLEFLGDVPFLRELSVGSDAFTSEGMSSLRFLPKLEKFELNTDLGVKADELHLNSLVSLKSLGLQGEQDTCRIGNISNATIAQLGELKNLERLNLSFCENITGTALIQLAKSCEKLSYIKIFYCQMIVEADVSALRLRGLKVDFSAYHDESEFEE